MDPHPPEVPYRLKHGHWPITEVGLFRPPSAAGPRLVEEEGHWMHRGENVHAVDGEDSGHLDDHAGRIRDEDQRMLMEDDVEFAGAESTQVAHVGAQVVELGPAAPRETAHRRELALGDVDERRGRAELGEEDRVPAPAAGQREHAPPLELDVFERAVRDAIEET